MKKCRATIKFGDDQQDNLTTFHCEREGGHRGRHRESGVMWGAQPYTLWWSEYEQFRLNPKTGRNLRKGRKRRNPTRAGQIETSQKIKADSG